MSLTQIGQSILVLAFLLGIAGTIEPTGWTSGIVAAFVLTGFAVWVHKSDSSWSEGYEQGLYEGCLQERNKAMLARTRMEANSVGALWKCGQEGCYCTGDARFRECESD